MERSGELDFHTLQALLRNLHASTDLETLQQTLEPLLGASRSAQGRSLFAATGATPNLLSLLRRRSLPPSLLFSLLKTLRNLCAGEISSQTAFVRSGGVREVLATLRSFGFQSPPPAGDVVRTGVQLLGNVALAGEEHISAVWDCLFPLAFEDLAGVHRSEVCDPLCMVLCVCGEESGGRFEEICGDGGLRIIAEIVKTAAEVGFCEDWLLLLLSRICFKEPQFSKLFWDLGSIICLKNSGNKCGLAFFTAKQAFYLSLLSEILNQQMNNIVVSTGFGLAVFEILKKASEAVDSFSRIYSDLPTGCPTIDVLGYSLTILRDICATENPKDQRKPLSDSLVESFETEGSDSVVDSLISSGLVTMLLTLLGKLDPPAIIRKSRAQEEIQGKFCPYFGYRRDIVSVISNCSFRRKQVQDEIRQQNGILLLMEQCVVDKENPFLREWSFWAMRNLLEGNAENQQQVAELELQGSVDTPEISDLGLRVQIDEKSKRPKLVNAFNSRNQSSEHSS